MRESPEICRFRLFLVFGQGEALALKVPPYSSYAPEVGAEHPARRHAPRRSLKKGICFPEKSFAFKARTVALIFRPAGVRVDALKPLAVDPCRGSV